MIARRSILAVLVLVLALGLTPGLVSTTGGSAHARPHEVPSINAAGETRVRADVRSDGNGWRQLVQQLPQAPATPAMRPRSWFVGTWETRNMEFGRDVTIVFVMRDDGSLAYDFVVDGEAHRGSTGSWEVQGGELIESWQRPDGSAGAGRGAIEVIDDNTFRLTIVDNGHAPYRGLVRIYRRKPLPQLSGLAPRRALAAHRGLRGQ